jgi:hypothetical protein
MGFGKVKNINTDHFLGILSVIVQPAFSFQGWSLLPCQSYPMLMHIF